jgi:cyclase
MLRPRIIPCLLIKDGALYKTVKFGEGKYVGDPINAVRIFNEKEVDELIVVDIDATVRGRAPDLNMIRSLAAECRMPLCYGGGVKTTEQIQDIISLGVEKVAISASAVENPELITAGVQRVGSQSIVVVMDVKTGKKGYELFTHNGKKATGLSPLDFARKMESLGAGEIVINAIDRDGTMEGYDLELASQVYEVTRLPMTVLGGAGSLKDVAGLVSRFGIVGAAAGSLFVFKGIYKAVLINYPNRVDRDALNQGALV